MSSTRTTPLGTQPVSAPTTSNQQPLERKPQGSALLVLLSLVVAGGLAWGGFIAANQIREKRSKEFLQQAIQTHLQDQRPVTEHIGAIETFELDEDATAQNAAAGMVVFHASGRRGSAEIHAFQRPNGLQFEMKLEGGETVELEPLVASRAN
ncbi:MAG: hypothetical protein R3C18_12035 [Planctomycetaceae bacterium]